ncbi:5039_t:CDS:2 [Paraglomus brasilianum]|uniref:5039_t:CDS:1 n=1 Tax=Paraglomus brasilianum TaxID=144538 RepID=A0A9N9B9W8_9GLOM|nr:5039_t:CDS:2 [Paraglomus brasilianum]
MKYLTLILVLATVAFVSATPSRLHDITNLAVRDVTGKYDGLVSTNGTCGDSDFALCPNSTICCPNGAACLTGGCDLQCTTEDITCGSEFANKYFMFMINGDVFSPSSDTAMIRQ